jgi:hypothetical protein
MPKLNENVVQYFKRSWKELDREARAEIQKQEMAKVKLAKWKKDPTSGKWIRLKK